jgi:hypothetical protein
MGGAFGEDVNSAIIDGTISAGMVSCCRLFLYLLNGPDARSFIRGSGVGDENSFLGGKRV